MSDEPGLFEVMYSCRAMRRIKPDAVPEDLLVKLIDAANQAPSGSNQQRARWIVARDPAVRARLAALNKAAVEAYVAPGGQRPASVAHQDAAKRERMLDALRWQAEHMQDIPALIVACILFDAPPDAAERLRGAGSIWPGVQNLLLAARALGLGATPTTLGLRDRDAVHDTLHMPPGLEAYCLIPVGWPMGRFGPVTRLPVEQTMRWDRWD